MIKPTPSLISRPVFTETHYFSKRLKIDDNRSVTIYEKGSFSWSFILNVWEFFGSIQKVSYKDDQGSDKYLYVDLKSLRLQYIKLRVAERIFTFEKVGRLGKAFLTPANAAEIAADALEDSLLAWAETNPGTPENVQKALIKIQVFLRYEFCKSLDLKGLGLVSLPSDLFAKDPFRKLERLDLEHNQLAELPREIGFLTALTQLNIKNNCLITLPTEIGLLVRLKYLEIENNLIQALPPQIGELVCLERLFICNNSLIELPPQIGKLEELQLLHIENNHLTALPSEIGGLKKLKQLLLKKNKVEALPAEIGLLTSLGNLNVNKNRLTALPVEIGDLEALKRLSITKNKVEELPPAISRLKALKYLYLSSNKLRTLPQDIEQLAELIELNIANNHLTALPSKIGQLSALKELNICFNTLTTLPVEIGQLSALKTLDISYNHTLTGLPNEILELPGTCTIDLMHVNLSQNIRDRLCRSIETPGYQGPRILNLMEHIEVAQEEEEETAEEFVAKFCMEIGEEEMILPNLLNPVKEDELSVLTKWLNRVSYIGDYNSSPDTKKWLIKIILQYLSFAENNENFRSLFFVCINDAAETCGDRMALSVINLGISLELEQEKEIHELAKFLKRGVFAMKLLEECAGNIVSTKKFVDELEVYLGLPVQLKERLKLPININEMLYYQCSGLTDQEVESSYEYVLKSINDTDRFNAFLITQDKWMIALKKKFPEEYQTCLDEKEKAGCEDDADFDQIEEQFNRLLAKL